MSDVILSSLEVLSQGTALSEDQAYRLMDAIMHGRATPAQMGGVLMALRVRGETTDELTGFARAMRDHATPVALRHRPVMDTCGTGGDRSFTFNVSTVSAFVVAGAGMHVAKHGNRSATSKSGSADLLEALGIPVRNDPDLVASCVDEVGFGFLFAQQVHGSMRHAGPVRSELGVRTVFNVLGPLTNPCAPEYQLLGVFDRQWVVRLAEVLSQLNVKRAMVVHGHGGLDEVSLSGPTEYGLVDQGSVSFGTLTPEDLGLGTYPRGVFRGGDPATNARICEDIIVDRIPGPMFDMVLANAGTALYVAGVADSPNEGVMAARAAIASGRAAGVLEALRARVGAAPERRDA